jgi:hypothetical protein
VIVEIHGRGLPVEFKIAIDEEELNALMIE